MFEKKGQKTKFKKVDMEMVKRLLVWRKNKNEELAGTKNTCTLRPKNSEPCISCNHFKDCKHYEWEREYIHKNADAVIDSNRRNNKKKKRQYNQKILNSHESNEPEYPCSPFDYDCPDKETC